MNCEDFGHVTDHVDSAMFLCLLSLLRVHLPSLSEFQRYTSSQNKPHDVVRRSQARKVAGSKVLSRFAPVSGLTRSSSSESLAAAKSKEMKKEVPKSKFGKTMDVKKSGTASGVRLTNKKETLAPSSPTETHEAKQLLFCQCGRQLVDFNALKCESCKQADIIQKIEGYLYGNAEKGSKLEKKWYVVDKKVIYCYNAKANTTYSKMRSLIGCFIKEEPQGKIDERTIGYPFTLAFSNSIVEKYYAPTKEECAKWCDIIRQTIGYFDIKDYYEFKVLSSHNVGNYG
eukprot:TRINITY_DN4007_c0_g3_i3.p2 TRINITY_DN4007_c0_g3~~TRINITY_DN4007_c0_g3_i3.p2  ORF type:complete len:285 (-),score=94.93 TRINITY_DN4007_c0_g3_i3:422-1276(-)